MVKKKIQPKKSNAKPSKSKSPKQTARFLLPMAACALGLFIGLLINQPVEQSSNIPLRPTFNIKPLFESPGNLEEEFPSLVPVLKRKGYIMAYDGRSKNPYLVMETITADTVQGPEESEKREPLEDNQVPKSIRAALDDYRNSGYEKAHLCPPADQNSNPMAKNESYLLTNMCPQSPQLNRGAWARFEKYVRGLTASYQTVKVFTGPLYLPATGKDGQRYVSYKVIGKNDVAVPTHFFKVLKLEKDNGDIDSKAYILPNEPVSSDISLDRFQTTLQDIEHLSGIIFN